MLRFVLSIAILSTLLSACGDDDRPADLGTPLMDLSVEPTVPDADLPDLTRDADSLDALDANADAPVFPPGGDVAFNPWMDGEPFAIQPDNSEGIKNVGTLDEVLEGNLLGACERYVGGEDSSNRARLLCGKEMFFFDALGTAGIPTAIVEFVMSEFEDEVGTSFSNYGLTANPFDPGGLPLGMAPGEKIGGTIDSTAFTCASCHFSQLSDGRFAVGAANHDYDYGTHILSLTVPLGMIAPGGGSDHHPDAIEKVQPLIDHIESNRTGFTLRALGALSGLIGAISDGTLSAASMSVENEGYYASWSPGTQDFLIEPLPVDDEVHTISKIQHLWDIPSEAEFLSAGMPSALLASTGGTYSLGSFIQGFVVIGGGNIESYPAERLGALEDYILSLRAPRNSAQDPALVTQGKALFDTAGCLECHDGPRGSSRDVFPFEDIGTDPTMKQWANPDANGDPCCGIEVIAGDRITQAIKAPRLTGVWASKRFLHNGALESLEQLFCLSEERSDSEVPGFIETGHDMTCAPSLSSEDRIALIAYLRSI